MSPPVQIKIVAVTGGRRLKLMPADYAFLDKVHFELGFTTMLNGDAEGADQGCKAWAYRKGIEVWRYPPDWLKFGKPAGPMRNADMVKDAQALIAFPGGKGTADMVAKCRAKGIPIYERTEHERGA